MGKILLKIAFYIAVVAIGFYVFPVFANIMIKLNALPDIDEGALALYTEKMLMGAIWFWLGGTVSGLFYFALKSSWRFLFLALPVALPLLYCFYFMVIGN